MQARRWAGSKEKPPEESWNTGTAPKGKVRDRSKKKGGSPLPLSPRPKRKRRAEGDDREESPSSWGLRQRNGRSREPSKKDEISVKRNHRFAAFQRKDVEAGLKGDSSPSAKGKRRYKKSKKEGPSGGVNAWREGIAEKQNQGNSERKTKVLQRGRNQRIRQETTPKISG